MLPEPAGLVTEVLLNSWSADVHESSPSFCCCVPAVSPSGPAGHPGLRRDVNWDYSHETRTCRV